MFKTEASNPIFGGIPINEPWVYNFDSLRVFTFKDGRICQL